MSRIVLLLAAGLIAAALLTGYFSDDSSPTTSTAAETTAPAATTPGEVKLSVFERSYSECSTATVEQLAAKYRVRREEGFIATAVARSWTKQFGAGPDAVASGEDGCLQGFREQ